MTWYYKRLGLHVHIRVFMNGAFCGMLNFNVTEFGEVRRALEGGIVTFKGEDEP